MSKLTLLLVLAITVLSAPVMAAQQSSTSKQQTRDWNAIDTNHDHYISPEEMQTYLDHVWAQHAKANKG